MTFYAVRFGGSPRIRYACTAAIAPGTRHNIIDHRKNILEISFHTCEEVRFSTQEESFVTGPVDIAILMPDERYDVTLHAAPGTAVTMTSVAAEIDGLELSGYHTDDIGQIQGLLDAAPPDTVFLPRIWSPEEIEFQELTALMHTIINNFAAGTTSRHLLCISDWYRICAMLDSAFRREIARLVQEDVPADEGSAYYYVRKAKKYICANCSDRLTLADIAENLGISTGYLCAVFKRGTGQTVVDYTNMIRMQNIRARICEGDDRRFSIICAEAGMHDIRYAQRLFKKYFGVSMQRYRQIENGISLYHKNPWTEAEVDHDLFKDEEP